MKLHLLLPLVLLPSTFLGELTRRAGLTALLGEVAVGALLGPALAGILPVHGGTGSFHELAHIGLCVLLFRLGMMSRFDSLAAAWKPGLRLGIVGMLVSWTLGVGITVAFGWSVRSAVFVGAALTATSISVPVTVLRESRSEQSAVGSTVLAAALVTDLSGLVFLSFLTTLFVTGSNGYGDVLRTLALSAAFLVVGVFVAPPALRRFISVTRRLESSALLLILAFSYLLLVAETARSIGLAMVIGAYAAGLAFSRVGERDRLEQEIRPLILVFRPLFFVLAGASISFSSIDVGSPAGRTSIAFVAALTVLAIVGKAAGAWTVGTDRGTHRVLAYGMVARGGMGFVFAEAGIRSGFVSPTLYSALALALTATTVVGAAGLRRSLSRMPRVP